MGVIQGSINNLLTLSAAAIRLSPGLEKERETRALEKDVKTAEKIRSIANDKDLGHVQEPVAKVLAEKQTRLAFLKPTEENVFKAATEIEGYEMQKDGGDPPGYSNPVSYEDKLAKRQNAVYDSMVDLNIKQNEIRNSRRR